MARKRKARGIKLNYPESVALICDELSELARVGKPYAEVVEAGQCILNGDDVLEGVAELANSIQVEIGFLCSVAADIAALVADKGFQCLKAPIKQVTSPHAPVPFSPVLEDHYLPNAENVLTAALSLFKQ